MPLGSRPRGDYRASITVETSSSAKNAGADADLRIRVRGVRASFRRARLRRGAAPPCPECGSERFQRLISPVSAAGSPAARRQGQVRRIAPRRARSRPPGAPRLGPRQAGAGRTAMSASAEERREALVDLYKEVQACTRCPLHETRTKAVFGAGNADADLMFVGEAPGAEEDRQGLPFVGRAGQLLNEMLGDIGLSREDVFIANVLKSRPPGNRDPQPLEIEACRPYLFEQVRLIEPKVVCTLGNFATKLLSGNPAGITRVRGTPQLRELGGRAVFLLPLFHPAAALRTPAVKETLQGRLRAPAGAARAARAGRAAGRPSEERRGRGRRHRRHRPPTSSTSSVEPPSATTTGSAAETEALGARIAAGLEPGDLVARLGRGRGRQDDADPRRLPGARGRGARHLADLHDRPALPGRRAAGSPTSTSTGSPASRARTRPCWTTISTPDSIAFVEWPAAATGRLGRPAARGPPAATPAATARNRAHRRIHAANRRVHKGAACSIAEETTSRRNTPDEGTEDADGDAVGSGAARQPGAGLGEHGRLQPLRRLRGVPKRETRPRLPESAQKGRFLQKQQRDGLLHGLRQVPDRQEPLRPARRSDAGHALRQQDHLEHPRQAPGELVRRRQESRNLRLHGPA